jgi:hypothetical protein
MTTLVHAFLPPSGPMAHAIVSGVIDNASQSETSAPGSV